MHLFSDLTSDFQWIDFNPSHCQLLIRSRKKINREFNIDIIFKGVELVLLPLALNGLEISILETLFDFNTLGEKYSFKIDNDYKLFSLKTSDSKVYIVNAMCFGVYYNKLDLNETSIGRYDFDNRGENIIWYQG